LLDLCQEQILGAFDNIVDLPRPQITISINGCGKNTTSVRIIDRRCVARAKTVVVYDGRDGLS
jgi:hypothetical protein